MVAVEEDDIDKTTVTYSVRIAPVILYCPNVLHVSVTVSLVTR